MEYPKFLVRNETIGVSAPSGSAYNIQKKNRYEHAIDFFQSQGYNVTISKNLFHCEKGRSASAKERGKEINEMFDSKDIDGIICAAGGEFLVEILPYIDFEKIKENPKLIAGFSDPTGLLYPITTKCDIATIYGSNFSSFGAEKLFKNDTDFLEVIQGKRLTVESYDLFEETRREEYTGLEPNNYTKEVEWKTLNNKEVEIEGRIIGGCLDIISELAGTKYDGIKEFNEKYQKDGIIWYFDNCELSMEETIRVLWKMKELEYFKYTKGILFGRFGVEKSYFEYDTKSCLEDSILKELNIPIIYDADISHKAPCIPIINGSIAHVKCRNGKGKIEFSLK